MNYNEVVGELVYQAMWRQHRTQTEVARLLGMSQPALSRKLRGTRPLEIGEVIELASILDVPITDLVPDTRNPRPGDPDGGAVRHQGLEPRTRWSIDNRGVTSNVVDVDFSPAAHPGHDVDLDFAAAA